MIRAMVYLYSGRPNPEWELKAAVYSKLLLLFKNCTPMATIPLQPFILGYSGCLVIEKNSKWHAWKGLLSITRNGEILYYNDPDRRIEKLVTGTAPSLVRAVIKSMEPGLI